MNRRLTFLILFIIWILTQYPVQGDEAVSDSVITAKFPDRSISAIVTHLARHDVFRRAIILMSGHPGILKIESPDSYRQKGNFLIRSRKYWLDRETVVFAVDAPTDQWSDFSGTFRSGERYAGDIRGLIREIDKTFGKMELVIVGTSEGSVSAYYAGLALSPGNVKVIFTSSLFKSSSSSHGLESVDFKKLNVPMLWVHHEKDPCPACPYWQAEKHASKTGSPLITVRSSNAGRGHPCEAFSKHGYFGVEEETVRAMKEWVVSGIAKDVVVP